MRSQRRVLGCSRIGKTRCHTPPRVNSSGARTDIMSKTFKTAEQLGLKKKHYCALVKTLVELESGRIKHLPNPSTRTGYDHDSETVGRFNMSFWCSSNSTCGTICCIGGTAEIVGGLPMLALSDLADSRAKLGNSGLHNLFYPYEAGLDMWDDITPKQACRALRNYLTCGRPKWKKAMKG